MTILGPEKGGEEINIANGCALSGRNRFACAYSVSKDLVVGIGPKLGQIKKAIFDSHSFNRVGGGSRRAINAARIPSRRNSDDVCQSVREGLHLSAVDRIAPF